MSESLESFAARCRRATGRALSALPVEVNMTPFNVLCARVTPHGTKECVVGAWPQTDAEGTKVFTEFRLIRIGAEAACEACYQAGHVPGSNPGTCPNCSEAASLAAYDAACAAYDSTPEAEAYRASVNQRW